MILFSVFGLFLRVFSSSFLICTTLDGSDGRTRMDGLGLRFDVYISTCLALAFVPQSTNAVIRVASFALTLICAEFSIPRRVGKSLSR